MLNPSKTLLNMRIHDSPYVGESDWRSDDYESMTESLEELSDICKDAPLCVHVSFHAPYPHGTSLPHYFARVMERLRQCTGISVDVYLPGKKAYSHCVRYFPEELRLRHQQRVNQVELVVTGGDIAHAKAQVIVNASNRRLELGGGVSGSLKKRFGSHLQALMKQSAGGKRIAHGELVMTSHPISSGVQAIYHVATASGSPEAIHKAINNIFEAAVMHGHSHIIMPALGCGTGGMTVSTFAAIVMEHIQRSQASLILEVWLWTGDDLSAFLEYVQDL